MKTTLRIGASLVLALGAAAGLQAAPALAPERSPHSAWTFAVTAQAEFRYDDNILGLSEREKDVVDPSDPNNDDRFGIESPDDVVFAPDLILRLARRPRGGRDTVISLTARDYEYIRNSVKDYQQYSLSVRQQLNRSRRWRTTLAVGVSHIPSYFLRRLIDDDASDPNTAIVVRNDADYTLNKGYVQISQEIVEDLVSVTAGYARERRDYNEDFDERDSGSNVYSLDLNVYPLRSLRFRIRPTYEHEDRRTRAGLASSSGTIVDDDVGFDADILGLELRWLWGPDRDRRRTVTAYYRSETRDFESGSPADPTHFGREDDITKYGAGYTQELNAAWTWGILMYHRENRVGLPARTDSVFEKNVGSVSLTWSFDRRLPSRSEADAD